MAGTCPPPGFNSQHFTETGEMDTDTSTGGEKMGVREGVQYHLLKLFTLLAPTTISHNPATPKIINIDHCIKAISSAAN